MLCPADARVWPAAIGIYKPQDVRPILGAYQGKDIPSEYAKFEAAAKQKHIEEVEAKRAAGGGRGLGTGGFTLSGLFGGSSVRTHLPTSIPFLYMFTF